MVQFKDTDTGNELDYYIEPRLQNYLDKNVRADLSKKDKDYPLLVDGYEGSGKSTFAQQIGKYIDPSLNLSRICMTADEFKEAVSNAEQNQTVIYDEAVTGMTAGDSISRIGKLLKSLMMQMRQKNLFVIIILPSVFEFNKYSVLSRAKAFFHVYETKGRRGYFAGYNRKDLRKLYLMGKKTYSYKFKSRFRGRFYGKYVVNEEEYRKKKLEALKIIGDDEKESTKERIYMVQRDFAIAELKKYSKLSNIQLGKLFERCQYPIKSSFLGDVARKLQEKTPQTTTSI